MRNFLAFEITKTWVKALWGKNTSKGIEIKGLVTRQLKEDSAEELSKIIPFILDKKIFKKYKPLVLCLPRSQITLRNLNFPTKDNRELDSIVKLHITQQVPYSREEIIYDYKVLEKTSSGYTKVLLGIVHRELLRKQFSPFEMLNLYPENVQLSTFGLMHLLQKANLLVKDDPELKMCLDIDSDFSDFMIFKGNEILFSKSIAIGYTLLREQDRLTRFIGELKQSIVVFHTEETRENPSRLYITGAIPEGVNIAHEINSTLQIPVETIDPISVTGPLKELKNVSKEVSFSALLGVAMKPMSDRFRFFLPEAKQKQDMRNMAKNLIATGSIIAYLIVLLLLSFIGKIYSGQNYLNKLNTGIASLESRNSEPIQILDKAKSIKNFTKQKNSFLYYYYELAKITPQNITINRLIFNKQEEFSLVGKGTDMGEIFKYVTVLNNAKIFGKIELRYSRKKTQDESEFNEFEIMCHLK